MGFEETNEAEIVKNFWLGFAETALELARAFQEGDDVDVQEKQQKFRAVSQTMPDLSRWVEEAHKAGTSLAAYILDQLSK